MAVLVVAAYSALASWALLRVVDLVVPLRVSNRDEGVGLDVSQHGEEAYVRGEGALLILRDALPRPAEALPTPSGLETAEGRS